MKVGSLLFSLVLIAVIMLAAFGLAQIVAPPSPALAASPGSVAITAPLQQELPPTPDEISKIVLAFFGGLLSLVFLYVPEAKTWYERLPHQGLVMLGMIVLIGLAYFGLGCWSTAAVLLHIRIACTTAGLFDLAQAIFAIAIGNQLTYLFAPTPRPRK